ncbi:DsbA family oxidoreductase [Fictibacillus phosphorivorans]|nr:DsbA family oxidoreductase [Fictibacillus phosphorivorans]
MGKKRLEDAIKQVDYPIEVTYRCFELDPHMDRDVKESIYEKLAKKYGMSIDDARANSQNVAQTAKAAGLDFQFDTMILTNTFDAHRVTMYAKKHGKMREMTERLLQAYFTESKHIGNHETLTELAAEVGLNRDEVAAMLASDELADDVRADEKTAQQYGVTGVPFFLLNKKYALTGAQPTEVFVQALKQVIAEDGITVLNGQDGGAICDDDGCEIPEK